jgi:hypothetical protein
MLLIQLSILLDNIEGEYMRWPEAVGILKQIVPEVNLVVLPKNQWKKYRKRVKVMSLKQQVPVQFQPALPLLMRARSLKEVPQQLRGFMASLYAQDKYPGISSMGISSPDSSIQKYKIMDMAADLLYGQTGDFLRKQGTPAIPEK